MSLLASIVRIQALQNPLLGSNVPILGSNVPILGSNVSNMLHLIKHLTAKQLASLPGWNFCDQTYLLGHLPVTQVMARICLADDDEGNDDDDNDLDVDDEVDKDDDDDKAEDDKDGNYNDNVNDE